MVKELQKIYKKLDDIKCFQRGNFVTFELNVNYNNIEVCVYNHIKSKDYRKRLEDVFGKSAIIGQDLGGFNTLKFFIPNKGD